mmetsp:Transcript_24752/g.47465  ORF Transcript_24752/g.47465 Transcript_24752/m.47465 type:complete len:81 (-) Transcript_24752:470-712(-)
MVFRVPVPMALNEGVGLAIDNHLAAIGTRITSCDLDGVAIVDESHRLFRPSDFGSNPFRRLHAPSKVDWTLECPMPADTV